MRIQTSDSFGSDDSDSKRARMELTGLNSARSMNSVRSQASFRRVTSMSSLHDDSKEDHSAWLSQVEDADAKFLMLDLDQAILHRVSGADATSSNQSSKFVTREEADIRKAAFEEANKDTHAFVVSKLPVGTGSDQDDDEEETWLLVGLRPGIVDTIMDAHDDGWIVGINTAMSPVHGQPIVEHLQDEVFGFDIPKELRFFRTSTCRDPARDPEDSRNIKNYDKPTWLTQLDFNRGEWHYQYQNSTQYNRDGSISWSNLELNEKSLSALCPDIVNGKVETTIEDNLTPSIITDELQRMYDTRNARFYEQVMGSDGREMMDPNIYKSVCDPRTNFKTPLFTDNGDILLKTISQRLATYAQSPNICILHFDDKDQDVRFAEEEDGEEFVPNRHTDAWYPQTSKKVGDKKRGDYARDVVVLRQQLALSPIPGFVETEEANQKADAWKYVKSLIFGFLG